MGNAFERTGFDIRMGRALKIMRIKMGYSQKEVARGAHITFQQIQKYETGDNRLSVSRLNDICKFLGVRMSDMMQEADREPVYTKQMAKLIEMLCQLNKDNLKMVSMVITNALASQPPTNPTDEKSENKSN